MAAKLIVDGLSAVDVVQHPHLQSHTSGETPTIDIKRSYHAHDVVLAIVVVTHLD
jgi:hypothetical protein